jgi:hypothetical protein
MEIIKNTDTIDVTCVHCNSVLKVTKFDIKYEGVFGHGAHVNIECPVCDRLVGVARLIPKHWKDWLIKTFEPEEDDVHG